MIRLHDRVTYRSDSFKEVLRILRVGAWKRLDEGYSRVGPLVASVEALNPNWHGGVVEKRIYVIVLVPRTVIEAIYVVFRLTNIQRERP